jgi:hypothetical protein
LEDEQSRVLGPRLEHLIMFAQRAARVGVPEVAVLGEDHPVQAVLGGAPGLLGERVLRVVG